MNHTWTLFSKKIPRFPAIACKPSRHGSLFWPVKHLLLSVFLPAPPFAANPNRFTLPADAHGHGHTAANNPERGEILP